MAESSSQNPSSSNITLKEEPHTQERPESLNSFLPVDQQNQPEGPPFTGHMKAICNTDLPVEFQASKTSSQTEKKTGASKSKTGQLDKETQSRSAKDKRPSYPSTSTHVVAEMYKEAQQAARGCDTSVDSTTKADPGKSAPRTNPSILVDKAKSTGNGLKTAHTNLGTNEESISGEISKKIKLEDLSNLMQDTRSTFFIPDSPQDEPIIIISDESQKEETERYEDTHATSHDVPEDTLILHPQYPKSVQIQELMAQVQLLQSQKDKLEQQKAKAKAEVVFLKARPSYPDINQLTKLLVTSLRPELSKLLVLHDFSNCLPAELKELPSKITELSGDVKELKTHIRDIEIELPRDIKEIPKKLETFTSTISSLTS
ncbi:hypothetical protein Tco_1226193 [Tanacetum coccineum]